MSLPHILFEFNALLWKNWCIRKCYYIMTLLELLVPIAAYILLFKIKENMVFTGGHIKRNTTIFPVKTREEIISESFRDSILDLLYAPSSNFTNKLMENVLNGFQENGISPGNYIGLQNESLVNNWFETKYGNKSMVLDHKGYGIIFENIPINGSFPSVLSYKIRNTKSEIWETDELFPAFQANGPMEAGRMYFLEGFVALQILLEFSYISLVTGETVGNFSMQEFPYPSYEDNTNFLAENFFSVLIPLFTLYGTMLMGPILIKLVIEEKESGVKEYMKMVGLRTAFTWISWVLFELMVYFWVSIILTVILTASINGTSVLEHTNPILLWTVIFWFFSSSIFFFLAVSSLFKNSSIGSAIGILLWVFPYHILSGMIDSGNVSLLGKISSAIFPSVSFMWISRAVGGYETMKKGLNFGNMFQMSSGGYSGMSVGISWMSNLFGILIWIFIIFYVDSVKPGKYGRRKPWFFIFMPFKKLYTVEQESPKTEAHLLVKDKAVIEEIPHNTKIGLSIRNLHKQFGNIIAVDHITIDIYHNQITALLGHNGAGKTTLLSIITGLFSPSEGDVSINGESVFSDLSNFRRKIGLCPQHNLLLSYLTVLEHIIFFGMLKGLSKIAAEEEGKEILRKLGLISKKNEQIRSLSGGMKRKLCLAISLTGNSQILILDEPTSGMDPESRREIWDLLLGLRENRTVIITTHFMEEADVLGDRIAIMGHGVIRCYGTSLFLKQHYGTGYHLKLILNDLSKTETISSIIKEIIPGTIMNSCSNSVISFMLPAEHSPKFSSLFTKLETDVSLHITGMGLSCTTMEDVFLSVSKEGMEVVNEIEKDMNDKRRSESLTEISGVNRENKGLTVSSTNGFPLFVQRCGALFMKKVIWNRHHWFASLFFVVVYPIIIALLTNSAQSSFLEGNTLSPSLLLELKMYGETEVLLSGDKSSSLLKNFSSTVEREGSKIQFVLNETILQGILEEAKKDELRFRSSMIVAADITNHTVLYSSVAIHAPPVAVNIYSNSFLSQYPMFSKNRIEAYNHPYDFITGLCIQNFSAANLISSAIWAFMLPMAFIVSIGYYINMVHKERISSSKRLQIMTGISPFTYWFANFLWDFIQFSMSVFLVMLTIRILDKYDIFSNAIEIEVLLLCLFLFGIGAIMMAYVASFFLQSYVNTYSLYFISSLVCGLLISFILNILIEFFPSLSNWHYIFMLNPYYSFSSCLYKIMPIATMKARCRVCWNLETRDQCTAEKVQELVYFSWSKHGMNTELLFLALDGLLYFSIVMILESGFIKILWNKVLSIYFGRTQHVSQFENSSVIEEKHAVDDIISQKRHSQIPLLVDNLGKKFSRKVTAVHGVSFMVSQGECFGLLGVNGAGKTSTFRMLTGDLYPSMGDATVFGNSLLENKKEYFPHIGYCPQIDGIIEELSGIQNIELYALLRGIHPSEISSSALTWISRVGLQTICHRPSGTYSGGNKRKLCAAIALVGDPSVIFLDEPTTGVDPLSRRKLWNILLQGRGLGQTVVITSHSMEECEALCDRLTIMAEGQMKCIGTIQNLKHVYGQGFSIKIKIKNADIEEVLSLKSDILKVFSHNCVLKDEHFGLLDYHLNDTSFRWSALFEEMEKLIHSHRIIEDYLISETTLEQVFLSFARSES